MIRITVELLPGGDASRARHLGTATIANDATGDARTGNYVFTLSKWGRPKVVWKRGAVRGFPRLARGPWDLLYLCLAEVVAVRNRRPHA